MTRAPEWLADALVIDSLPANGLHSDVAQSGLLSEVLAK